MMFLKSEMLKNPLCVFVVASDVVFHGKVNVPRRTEHGTVKGGRRTSKSTEVRVTIVSLASVSTHMSNMHMWGISCSHKGSYVILLCPQTFSQSQ